MKDGGPAFPVPDTYHPNGQVEYGATGMSLRDWFAGRETLEGCEDLPVETLEALAGRPWPRLRWPGATAEDRLNALAWNADWRARLKFIRADAMLRARERGQEGSNQ